MLIQFNTDKTIKGDERNQEFFTSQIADELDRYRAHITRIEVHLKDVNGEKEGTDDKHCLLEARLKGMKPIAVTNHGTTIEQAVSGATHKLVKTLETRLGRLNKH
ncbi:MAG: HPF/RaiA family ribosome-associated protein [Saprospiraceae bacterium]